MTHGVRPTKKEASKAIKALLKEEGLDLAFDLCEDGEDGWAFWINDRDTTSYVHHDLKIEWYGTCGEDEEEDDDA